MALVLMPEGSEFRRWYPPTAQREITELLTNLTREYRAPLIDAREWVADDHFFDAHHLRTPGATRFSARLKEEILSRQLPPCRAQENGPAHR